jgi:hypothetical protein
VQSQVSGPLHTPPFSQDTVQIGVSQVDGDQPGSQEQVSGPVHSPLPEQSATLPQSSPPHAQM